MTLGVLGAVLLALGVRVQSAGLLWIGALVLLTALLLANWLFAEQ